MAYSFHVTPSTPGAAFRFRAKKLSCSSAGVTWWSKAVNRSCLCFRALSRTPCNPCDTLSPLWVGCVLDPTMFSLVTGLPSTTSAGGVSAHFVRRLLTVLCPCSTPRRRACPDCAFGFPDRSGFLYRPRMPTRSLGSRACSFSTCGWLLDYAGPDENSRCRFRQCGLPVGSIRSAPGIRFSKLDSSPVDASVYTSPGPSRRPAQDSRSRWFAIPFLWGTCIPDCTPVYPHDCAP